MQGVRVILVLCALLFCGGCLYFSGQSLNNGLTYGVFVVDGQTAKQVATARAIEPHRYYISKAQHSGTTNYDDASAYPPGGRIELGSDGSLLFDFNVSQTSNYALSVVSDDSVGAHTVDVAVNNIPVGTLAIESSYFGQGISGGYSTITAVTVQLHAGNNTIKITNEEYNGGGAHLLPDDCSTRNTCPYINSIVLLPK